MKSLNNFENFEACSVFQVAAYDWLRKSPVILKIVPKAGYDMYTREDLPMTAKESRNRNSEAAFGTIFRTSKCVQKKKQVDTL
jgi:hypothetical protein